MAAELQRILNESVQENLTSYIDVLRQFKERAEIVVEIRDGLGLGDPINPDIRNLDVIYAGGLVRKEVVGYVVGFPGNILIYELNDKGAEVFKKLFNEEPKRCFKGHYATPG